MNTISKSITIAATVLLLCSSLRAQTNQSDQISDAANSVNRLQRFTFRHQLKVDEQIRWDVEHIATVKTNIGSDVSEHIVSRTNSTKRWKVIEVDSRGNMTFQNSIERLVMWNKSGDDKPSSYDSEKDSEAPPMFRAASDSVGVTLSTITISPSGRLVNRNSDSPASSFGAGGVTIPFPGQPIGIGHQWSVPSEHTAKHSDGRVKIIKSRRLFTLASVENQIATIEFKTEILTPIEDPTIQSQLLQKMNRGLLRFDLTAGRVIYQEIDWNETVQGFQGADSKIEYMARFTEELRKPRVSSRKEVKNETADVVIKPNDGKPIIRKR